jgi:hypothetical protein
MTNEDNTDSSTESWDGKERRSQAKEVSSQSPTNVWRFIRGAVMAFILPIITTMVTLGYYTKTVDVNEISIVEIKKDINARFSGVKKDNDSKFNYMLASIHKNTELIHKNDVEKVRILTFLEAQVVQQKESDERFEEKFDDTIRELKDMNKRINTNEQKIINIYNNKTTSIDNTQVTQFAMLTGAY